MPAPGAGELNKKITIQVLTTTKDGQGGKKVTPGTWLDKVSAKVVNLSGNEQNVTSMGGTRGEARTVFTIRFRDGLTTTKHQILYKGVTYNIKHINNWSEEGRFQVITCDTGNANV